MIWINFFILVGIFLGVHSEKLIDVRLCYDESGCSRHQLTCQNTKEQIIITEAFLGFNCSKGSKSAFRCRRNNCCLKEEDFQCWDVLDIVSIRVLCEGCWKKSSCSIVDIVSPYNRCKSGAHVLPVYSIIRYRCQTEANYDVLPMDDMCYEYQTSHIPFHSTGLDSDLTEGSTPKPSSTTHHDNRDISLGIGITAGVLIIVIIVILVLLFLAKRQKKIPESSDLEIKDASLSQSQYHVLESRRQSKISDTSNRNSTYYNTVDVSVISISDLDNTHFRNIVSTKRKKLPGNRNSCETGEISQVSKNDNSTVKGGNTRRNSRPTRGDAQVLNETDHTYDTLQLTSMDNVREITHTKHTEDDDYDHLIRNPIRLAKRDGGYKLM